MSVSFWEIRILHGAYFFRFEVVSQFLSQLLVVVSAICRVWQTFLQASDFFPAINDKCIFLVERFRNLELSEFPFDFLTTGSSPGIYGWDFRFLVAILTCPWAFAPASACSVSDMSCRSIDSRVEVFCLFASLARLQTLLVRFLLLLICFLLLNFYLAASVTTASLLSDNRDL